MKINEITVTRDNDEVVVHLFKEKDEIKAIVENGFKVRVNGESLEKPTKL